MHYGGYWSWRQHSPSDQQKKYEKQVKDAYKKANPAIFVCGYWDVEYILHDHPEISTAISVETSDREGSDAFKLLTENRNHYICKVDDVDERANRGWYPPSEENMSPLLDYLKEWVSRRTDNNLPESLLVHCAAGQYRSPATALTAHMLYSGDPIFSATELVMNSPAGNNNLSANWEISRIMDDMLRLGGVFLSAAKNIPSAKIKRDEMLYQGEKDVDYIRSKVSEALRVPIPVPEPGDRTMHAAAAGSDPRAVEALLAAECEAGPVGNNEQVPLHRAAISGTPEIIEILIDQTPYFRSQSTQKRDALGRLPLDYALNNPRLVDMPILRKLEIVTEEDSLLHS